MPASQGGAWVLAGPSGSRLCGSEGFLGEPEPTWLPGWFAQLGIGCEASQGKISHDARSRGLPLQGLGSAVWKLPEVKEGSNGGDAPLHWGSRGSSQNGWGGPWWSPLG